jgi:TolA-binding protein
VVQFNIGWEYFSKERYTEALPELKLVMQKYPDSQLMQRVLFNLGDAYYNLKQYDSARVYYGRVIREYPSSLLVNDALSGLQYTYAAQGKPAGALAEIDTILRSRAVSTPKEELVLRKGDILFSQADFAGAIREYQSVLAENPSHGAEAKALHQLGRSYEMENNPERALSYYRKIVDQFSDTDVAPAAALSLATAQIKGGQFRDAAGVLGMFERKYPDSPLLTEVKFYHGIALAGLPDTKGAMEIFQALIREHGDDIFSDKSRLEIGRILQERHDYAASLDTLTGLVTRRSDDLAAEGLVMIGHNYLAMKRTTDALQAFNDCIRQYTDYPLWVDRARLGLGEAYEKLRDRTRARAAYQEVVTSTVDPALKKEAEQKIRRLHR